MAPIMKFLPFVAVLLSAAAANPINGPSGGDFLATRGDITCANVRCTYRCEMVDNRPKCIAKPEQCGAVECNPGDRCDMSGKKPKCIPKRTRDLQMCGDVQCRSNQHCDMSNKKPKCVSNKQTRDEPVLTCATVKCIAGYRCEIQDNKPKCLQECGTTTCPSGEVCCNPLCNMCVKPGMMCTQGSCPILPETQPAARAPEPESESIMKCGKNTCGSGEYCCNSSCGTCAKIGAGCTKQFCTEPQQSAPAPEATAEKCGNNTCGKGEYCCNKSCGTCAPTGGMCTMEFCKEPKPARLAPEVTGKCGKNTCGKGQYCCNKSCGICAPTGGVCTQQFCTEPQSS